MDMAFVEGRDCRLRSLGPDLWGVQGYVRSRLLGRTVDMSVRMVVVRLAAASRRDLLVVSPFPPTRGLRAQLAELGDVKYVFAPNAMHYAWAGEFKQAYDAAVLLGVASLRKKLLRDRPKDYLLFDRFLDGPQDAPAEWAAGGVDILRVRGFDAMGEYWLFHAPSRSLLVADLIFNFTADAKYALQAPASWLAAVGGLNVPGTMNRVYYYWMENVREVAASFEEALERWDFDRVVVLHGDAVSGDGKRFVREGVLRQLSEWSANPPPSPMAVFAKSVAVVSIASVLAFYGLRALRWK